MHIAYLDERLLSLNGLKDAFSHMYPHASIKNIPIDTINTDDIKKFQIVVLPGCNGEDSPYPALLPQSRIDTLKNAMENNGLVLITFCAASYFMAEKIIYETKKGEIKERAGAGLIKGTASHAFRHITRPHNPEDGLQDYIQALLTSPMTDSSLKILNVNGPAFHLDKTERCESFLEYEDAQGAAGIIQQIGKGKLIALGVHPELSSKNSDKRFAGQFIEHESDRFILLNLIRNIIEDHIDGLAWRNHTAKHHGLNHV